MKFTNNKHGTNGISMDQMYAGGNTQTTSRSGNEETLIGGMSAGHVGQLIAGIMGMDIHH